jgi:hypothetical protein
LYFSLYNGKEESICHGKKRIGDETAESWNSVIVNVSVILAMAGI